MVFDRAHRVGAKTGSKGQPSVVKFQYYHERELVRKPSFDYSEALKGENMSIGAQLPKDLRDARKPFYPATEKKKQKKKKKKSKN